MILPAGPWRNQTGPGGKKTGTSKKVPVIMLMQYFSQLSQQKMCPPIWPQIFPLVGYVAKCTTFSGRT